MADRFWVGNGGNWSDAANHWSATSGGSPGASKPTISDSVYFDVNSFTLAAQTVTVDEAANCLDMNWTGALNTPTLAGNKQFNIYGNLTFIAAMGYSHSHTLYLYGACHLTTNGVILSSRVSTATSTTSIILEDDLTTTNTNGVNCGIGVFNSNNKNIHTTIFTCTGTNARTLTLGSSVVTCSGNITFATTNLTLTANTAKFIMTGNTKTFEGVGLTFNELELLGTPTTITGSNTFNKLTVATGKTLKLTAGTTQTITKLVADGATIQSLTTGTPATITTPNTDLVVRTATIKDITATKPIYALRASVDGTGNTGVTFTTKVYRGQASIPSTAAAPATTEGQIYYNSTDKHFYGYNGTDWKQLDNA